MKKYLATLHEKPESHKKRFALAVSGGFTLLMFSLWSLATFGTGGTLAKNETVKENEVSPISSLVAGVSAGFDELKGSFSNLYGR